MSESATIEAPKPIVRRSKLKRSSELDSREIPIPQKDRIVLPPIHEPVEREASIVQVETPLLSDDLAKLAFNEEPVTILIHRSAEKFAPRSTDLISVNGKWAEMWFKNGWVPIGYLPRGQHIIVKRKYVEVLARAKQDFVRAEYSETPGQDPTNFIERSTVSTCAFNVVHDANPLGREWFEQLMRQQG